MGKFSKNLAEDNVRYTAKNKGGSLSLVQMSVGAAKILSIHTTQWSWLLSLLPYHNVVYLRGCPSLILNFIVFSSTHVNHKYLFTNNAMRRSRYICTAFEFCSRMLPNLRNAHVGSRATETFTQNLNANVNSMFIQKQRLTIEL